MFAALISNLPGFMTAFIAAIPAILLAINTVLSNRTRTRLELIDPALNILGITYTALETEELKAFQRLKLKKWFLIFAFLLTTYVTIYLFIFLLILDNQFLFLYIGIVTIIFFSLLFVYTKLRGYSFFGEIGYSLFRLNSPNGDFVVFQKAEMMIQADYPYLIAKCYQALKSLKVQTVKIQSDDDIRNSSLSSSKIAISLLQTDKPGTAKIIIEPVIGSNKTNDYEESSKYIETLIERVLDIPSNYTPPLNLRIKIEP